MDAKIYEKMDSDKRVRRLHQALPTWEIERQADRHIISSESYHI